jgi:hypothetical protein
MVKRCGCGYPYFVQVAEVAGTRGPVAVLLTQTGEQVQVVTWFCGGCKRLISGRDLRESGPTAGTPLCQGYRGPGGSG